MSRVLRPVAVEARVERLRRLSALNRAYTYTTSLDEVAQLTVEGGAELLDATAALVMLQDAEDLMQVRATFGIADEQIARFRAPLSDEVIERLQGLLQVPDVNFVAVPLVVGGAVTGIVAVALRRPSTEHDEWMLSALADQAAVALQNARIGGEVRVDLEARLRASQGATDAKDRALSTLAHDIRSPLGAIEGYCAILEDEMFGPVTGEQRDAIGRIRMSGRHLLSLLENVMDMARLTAGPVALNTLPVRLLEIARDAIDMLLPASLAKHQELTFVGAPDIMIAADAARLRQVLINLVGNAVKFTDVEGLVTVTVAQVTVGDALMGEVRVTDTGPGIADTDRASIFEPYFRSEGTVALPGIGLGLTISRALIQQMHGTLEVESAVGFGSSFIVRLPALGAHLTRSR